MDLHHSPMSYNALKKRALADVLSIDENEVGLPKQDKGDKKEDFLAINHMAQVPAIKESEFTFKETNPVVNYLATLDADLESLDHLAGDCLTHVDFAITGALEHARSSNSPLSEFKDLDQRLA